MSFEYRGLKGVKKSHLVTEEEIKQQMEHLAASRPRVSPITDRPAKNGDEVILDYAGFCEGVQSEPRRCRPQTVRPRRSLHNRE